MTEFEYWATLYANLLLCLYPLSEIPLAVVLLPVSLRFSQGSGSVCNNSEVCPHVEWSWTSSIFSKDRVCSVMKIKIAVSLVVVPIVHQR